tara:strand:+ start:2934 stop:6755 length:3822 start_codon:yes stop_codon:yes gene_type:complete
MPSRGGSVSNLRDLKPEERADAFKDAAIKNSWIGASFKTNEAFAKVVEDSETAIKAYKTALSAGTTLLHAQKALAIGQINPVLVLIPPLVEAMRNAVDDFLESGIYWLWVDSQQDQMAELYDLKKREPKIKLEKQIWSGIFLNPFTNKVGFHVHPIENINRLYDLAAEFRKDSKYIKLGVGDENNPYIKRINNILSRPNDLLVWNGDVFYRRTIPGIPESGQGKPMFIKQKKKPGTDQNERWWDKIPIKKVVNATQGMSICPPSKMIDIVNQSFDDMKDPFVPRFSKDAQVGALFVLIGTSDPTKLVEKAAKLYNYFSTLKPLKDFWEEMYDIQQSLENFRTQTMVVTNLCAPNRWENNPAHYEVPFKPGKKSHIKADRGLFKIGTNSDNIKKFSELRSINIRNHKNDKVFLMNLRNGDVAQIIKVGKAKEQESILSDGRQYQVNEDGQTIVTDPASQQVLSNEDSSMFSFFEPDQSFNVFQQNTEIKMKTWQQEVVVLHNGLFNKFEPGDTLVEVELDDMKGLVSSDGTEYSAADGDVNNHYPKFVLKNGTKVFGDELDINSILSEIQSDRNMANDNAAQIEQLKLFRHYEAELANPESMHFEKTKYITEISPLEAREQLQKTYGITPSPHHVYATGEIDISQSTVFSKEQREQDSNVKEAFNKYQNASKSIITNVTNEVEDAKFELRGAETDKLNKQKEIDDITDRINVLKTTLIEQTAVLEELNFDKRSRVQSAQTDVLTFYGYESEDNIKSEIDDVTQSIRDLTEEITLTKRSIRDTYFKEHYTYYSVGENQSPEVAEQNATEFTNNNIEDIYAEDTSLQNLINEKNAQQSHLDEITQLYETAKETANGLKPDLNQGQTQALAELDRIILLQRGKVNTTQIQIKSEVDKIEGSGNLRDELIQIEDNIVRLQVLVENPGNQFLTALQLLEAQWKEEQAILEQIQKEARKKLANYKSLYDMLESEGVEVEKYASGKLEKITNNLTPNSQLTINDFNFIGTSPDMKGNDHWERVLKELVITNPDRVSTNNIPSINIEDMDDLTDEESDKAVKLLSQRVKMDLTGMDPKMVAFFRDQLDGYMYLETWKGESGDSLPAPRYCTVGAVEDNQDGPDGTSTDPKIQKGVYPHWNHYTLEDFIPQLRTVLTYIVDQVEKLQALGEDIIAFIDRIIKFIEEEVIDRLDRLIKKMEELVNLLKLGVVDAGIYFLYVPLDGSTDGGKGMERIRKKLVNSKNKPPDNIDYTWSLTLLAGTASGAATMKIIEKIGGVKETEE